MAAQVIGTVAEMVAAPAARERAVVMSMGALHAGHASLIEHARRLAGPGGEVLVTIFVNPLQFGPGEDYTRYPRTWEQDLRLCADLGVDTVFAPAADDLYRGGTDITVDPGPLGDVFEGQMRPGHFRGMLTVVAKLLNLTRPRWSVYGEKDYQQLVLIEKMVAALNLAVEVVGSPTVRDADGLALSSRNSYLTPAERATASALPHALAAAAKAVADGASGGQVVQAATEVVRSEAGAEPDYVALTAPDLGAAPESGPARLLLAVKIGTPRLIDNAAILLEPR